VSFKTRYTRSPHSIREVIHARRGAVLLHAQVGRIRTERRRRQRRQ